MTNPELSVVLPCLNEQDTLGVCLQKIQQALHAHGIAGEIIVADNGSTDDSAALARAAGARVISVTSRGYGNALMGGIHAAQGRYIIMGDADDSYDFAQIPLFLEKLRAGAPLVQGCRLPRGGGTVMPGAMPFLHRWLGNPLFSYLTRQWFGAAISDIYCGLRGFTRELYDRLDLRCTGMEFATEMIIKAALHKIPIAEVPITLHPDGRKTHAPHLKTWRDGWRTLRFFLLYSPRWLFLLPGEGLLALGLMGYILVLPGFHFRGINLDAHTLLFASLCMLCGYQAILFALFTRLFAISEGLQPPDARLDRFFQIINLERGLLLGLALILAGLALWAGALAQWIHVHLGNLDYAVTMRWAIPGFTCTALGFQTVLASFFASILAMKRK